MDYLAIPHQIRPTQSKLHQNKTITTQQKPKTVHKNIHIGEKFN